MELPKLSKQLNLFEGDHSQQSFEWQRLCHDNSLMTTALEKLRPQLILEPAHMNSA